MIETPTFSRVSADEIETANRVGRATRWGDVIVGLYAGYQRGEGLFLPNATTADGRNLSQSIRQRKSMAGLRLRMRTSTRNGEKGLMVWLVAAE